jgi:hypothetical protein
MRKIQNAHGIGTMTLDEANDPFGSIVESGHLFSLIHTPPPHLKRGQISKGLGICQPRKIRELLTVRLPLLRSAYFSNGGHFDLCPLMGHHRDQDPIGREGQPRPGCLLRSLVTQGMGTRILPLLQAGSCLLGQPTHSTLTHLDVQQGFQLQRCAGKWQDACQHHQSLLGMRGQSAQREVQLLIQGEKSRFHTAGSFHTVGSASPLCPLAFSSFSHACLGLATPLRSARTGGAAVALVRSTPVWRSAAPNRRASALACLKARHPIRLRFL